MGGVEYATALFERATIERYVGYFRTLLEGMVADENETIGWTEDTAGRGAGAAAVWVERDEEGVSGATDVCMSCLRSRWRDAGSNGGGV